MADISSNLLYYYKFDKEDRKNNTLKNHANGNYDASISSSSVISNRNYYIGNSSLDCERGTFYVPVTIPTTGFSISFWICGTTNSFHSQLGNIMGMYYYNYSDHISFYHETERAFAYNVTNNIWNHIIITLSPTGTNNFVSYKNGKLHVARSLGNNYPPSSTYISLLSKYFFYDDFRVYNYVISSEADINYLLYYPNFKKYTNSLSSASLLSKLNSNFYDTNNQNIIFDNEPRNMIPGTIVLLSGKPTSKTSNLGNYTNSVTYSSISQAIFNSQYSALYIVDDISGSISIINTQSGIINVLPTMDTSSKTVENKYNLNPGIKSIAFDISQKYYYLTNGSYVQQMDYTNNTFIKNINTDALTSIQYCITDSSNILYIAHSTGINKINLSGVLPSVTTVFITSALLIQEMVLVNNKMYAINDTNLEIYVINPLFIENQTVSRAVPSTINTNTYTYTSSDIYNGIYSVSSSSTNGTNYPYKAFDNNITTEYRTASFYDVSGSGYSSTQNINGIKGEFLTIRLPYALNLTSYTILSSSTTINCIKAWVIFVNDGLSWSAIDTRTGQNPNTLTTYTLATPVQSFQFAIVITSTNNTTYTSSWASLLEFNLIGTYKYYKLLLSNLVTVGSKLSSICGDKNGNLYVSTTNVTRCIFFIPIVFLNNYNTSLYGLNNNRVDILAYTQITNSIGSTGDGGLGINATFSNISNIMMDAGNNMYICDTSNCTIRKIINKPQTTNFLNTITDEMNVSSQYDISTLYSPTYSIGTNQISNYCIGTNTSQIDTEIKSSNYNIIDSSGLILYYRFNSQDVNGVNLANYSTGFPQYDASLSLTGLVNSTDFALDNAALNIPTTGFVTINNSMLTTGINTTSLFNQGLSFAFWVKSNNTSTNGRIFEFGNQVSATYTILITIVSNILTPTIAINNSYTVYNTSYAINNNVWRHICWTLTYSTGSTSTYNVYVDGSIIYTITSGKYPSSIVTYPLCYIGKSTWTVDPSFNGSIDDFRFYNRILSQSEVSTLYNNIKSQNEVVDLNNYLTTDLTVGNGAIPTFTVSGTETSPATYTITNSSTPIFNGNYIVSWSGSDTTNIGPYIFDNNNTTFTIGNVSIADWWQIQLPYKLKLTGYSYLVNPPSSYTTLTSYYWYIRQYTIQGSNDGTNWNNIDILTYSNDGSGRTTTLRTITFNSNSYYLYPFTSRGLNKNYYSYFRFTINQTGESGLNSSFSVLNTLKLYGIGITKKYTQIDQQYRQIQNIYPLTDYIAVPTMTSKTTIINEYITPSILNGTYRCTSSANGYSDNYFEYFAFDSSNSTFWNSNFKYDSAGNYIGTNTITITTLKDSSTIISVIGEWIQIQLPYSLLISGYRILPRSGYAGQFPKNWYMVGSNDGSNWYVIDYEVNISVASNTNNYYNYGNSYGNKNYYSYFRIIIMSISGVGSTSGIALSEINLQGTGKPLEYYINTYELPSYNAVPTMTSTSTTITGNMPAILNGTYNTSASTIYSATYDSYIPFSTSGFWNSSDGIYNGSGSYTGIKSTITNIGSISGEWIQIKLPYSLSLTGYSMLPRTNFYIYQFPKSWYLVGSNDGTTWYAIDYQNYTTISYITYYSGNSYGNKNYYNYFRIIVVNITSNGGGNGTTISTIKLQGTGITTIYDLTYTETIPVLSSDTVTLSSKIPSILNGTYIASSSSNFNDSYKPYMCFNNSNTQIWQSSSLYNSVENAGIYIGSVTTIITTPNSTISGEWIQIQLPYSLSLLGYTFLPRSGFLSQYPKKWYLVGSNNGSTWYAIDYQSESTATAVTYYSYGNSYGNTIFYKYFRVITTATNNDRSGANNVVALDEIQLQGIGM